MDAVGWALAVGAHVAIVAAVAVGRPPPSCAPSLSEVALEEPPRTPPRVEPQPAPPPTPERHAAAPAQAAKALVVPPAPDEPPPDPDETLVTGDAETYLGGVTAENGTGTGRGNGDGLGEGDAPPPPPPPPTPPPDRSRAARCALDVDWGCEFPDGEREGIVVFAVHVRNDGLVTAADVIAAPSPALAHAAQECAAKRRCEPALDSQGRIVTGITNPIRMRFVR